MQFFIFLLDRAKHLQILILILPNDGLVAFHYSSYGTLCLHSKSSIISTVVLPTTEIIEPPIDSQRIKRIYFHNIYHLQILL